MESRKIIDELIRSKKSSRIGIADKPWPETLEKWTEQGYPVTENNRPVNPVVHFGFDMEEVGGWFDWEPLVGFREILEETDEWYIVRNGAGAALKYWKHKCGTPEHVDFKMNTREIWEQEYRPHLLEVDERRLDIEGTKKSLERAKERGTWTCYGHLGLWEFMRSSLGDINMFETLLLDPEWVCDFNRVYTDFYLAHYKVLFEKAGIPDGIWLYDDLAYKNGPFCSPDTLRELFFPFYKEIADFFHSYDLPVVFHCCGNMEKVLPIIVDAGYDALNPMEHKAGCDPLKFARMYKDKLAFIGGLDATILEKGNREEILAESKRLIDGMKALGAAYIFGSDHSVSPIITYDNFKAAIDFAKANGAYSK